MPEFLKRPLKLYLDTSVLSHLFAEDAPEKRRITEALFRSKIRGQYEFYISAIVTQEFMKASIERQRQLFAAVEGLNVLEFRKEAEALALTYLETGAFPKSSYEDAQHAAIATLNNLDAVVSWNFKDLVNLRRIKLVNAVNEQMGYKHIEIISPMEVVSL